MLYIQFCMWQQNSFHVKVYPKHIVAKNKNTIEREEKEKPAIIIWYKHNKHRQPWARCEKSIVRIPTISVQSGRHKIPWEFITLNENVKYSGKLLHQILQNAQYITIQTQADT